jgi:hypothetical protein
MELYALLYGPIGDSDGAGAPPGDLAEGPARLARLRYRVLHHHYPQPQHAAGLRQSRGGFLRVGISFEADELKVKKFVVVLFSRGTLTASEPL